MNAAHLHLIMNHLPVLGSLLGAAVLVYGLSVKSLHTRLAGFYLLILGAIGGIITYLSGEEAEEILEHTDAMHEAIEAHEDFAVYALVALILSGLVAGAALVFTRRRSPRAGSFSVLALVMALLSAGVAGYTGLLGGKIMHPETTNAPVLKQSGTPAGTEEEQEEEEENVHDHEGHEH